MRSTAEAHSQIFGGGGGLQSKKMPTMKLLPGRCQPPKKPIEIPKMYIIKTKGQD